MNPCCAKDLAEQRSVSRTLRALRAGDPVRRAEAARTVAGADSTAARLASGIGAGGAPLPPMTGNAGGYVASAQVGATLLAAAAARGGGSADDEDEDSDDSDAELDAMMASLGGARGGARGGGGGSGGGGCGGGGGGGNVPAGMGLADAEDVAALLLAEAAARRAEASSALEAEALLRAVPEVLPSAVLSLVRGELGVEAAAREAAECAANLAAGAGAALATGGGGGGGACHTRGCGGCGARRLEVRAPPTRDELEARLRGSGVCLFLAADHNAAATRAMALAAAGEEEGGGGGGGGFGGGGDSGLVLRQLRILARAEQAKQREPGTFVLARGLQLGSDEAAALGVVALPALLGWRRAEVQDTVSGELARRFSLAAAGADEATGGVRVSGELCAWLRQLQVIDSEGGASDDSTRAGAAYAAAAAAALDDAACTHYCDVDGCNMRTLYRHDHIGGSFFASEARSERFMNAHG